MFYPADTRIRNQRDQGGGIMSSILIFGGYAISMVTAQKFLERKNRHDLAKLLEVLFQLSLIGLGGYILIDFVSSLINMFGGFPRL